MLSLKLPFFKLNLFRVSIWAYDLSAKLTPLPRVKEQVKKSSGRPRLSRGWLRKERTSSWELFCDLTEATRWLDDMLQSACVTNPISTSNPIGHIIFPLHAPSLTEWRICVHLLTQILFHTDLQQAKQMSGSLNPQRSCSRPCSFEDPSQRSPWQPGPPPSICLPFTSLAPAVSKAAGLGPPRETANLISVEEVLWELGGKGRV